MKPNEITPREKETPASVSPAADSTAGLNNFPALPAVGPARKETLFHLVAKSARNVLLAADFTGWDQAPLKMVKTVGGIWNIKVPLPPGKYRYRFLIDHQASSNAPEGGRLSFPFGTLSG